MTDVCQNLKGHTLIKNIYIYIMKLMRIHTILISDALAHRNVLHNAGINQFQENKLRTNPVLSYKDDVPRGQILIV